MFFYIFLSVQLKQSVIISSLTVCETIFLPITIISILPIRAHELQKELKFHFKKNEVFHYGFLCGFTEKILMENLIFCPVFAFLDNYFF